MAKIQVLHQREDQFNTCVDRLSGLVETVREVRHEAEELTSTQIPPSDEETKKHRESGFLTRLCKRFRSAQFNSAQDPFSLFTALFPFSENVCMSLNEYMVLDKHQSLLSKHVFVQWIYMFPSIGFFLGFPFSSLALSC